MKDNQLFEHITLDPEVMVGKPIIKGTRLTVQYILGLLANGASNQDIINEYHGLTCDDILACLQYASKAIDNITFMPLSSKAV